VKTIANELSMEKKIQCFPARTVKLTLQELQNILISILFF